MERPTEISGKTELSRTGRALPHGRMKGPRYGEEPPVRRKRPWRRLGWIALFLAAGSWGAGRALSPPKPPRPTALDDGRRVKDLAVADTNRIEGRTR